MTRLPTIRQLQYLSALRKTLHFGKAAKSCFVSQSAFSTAIKELETQLDISLVDRTNRSVVFTPAGEAIETQGRRAISIIDELVDLAKSVSEPFSGVMRLGIIPTIAPYLLPNLLPGIKSNYPNLRLYIREGQSQSLYEQLITGELDLVLYAQPYAMPHIESVALANDRFHFAYHQATAIKTPLTKRGEVNLRALNPESLLLLEDGHCLREHALASCKLDDLSRVSQFSANTLQTLVQMVNSDLGVTILPDMAMQFLDLGATNIKTEPLAKKYYRTIALAWREGSSRAEEFKSIATTIESVL